MNPRALVLLPLLSLLPAAFLRAQVPLVPGPVRAPSGTLIQLNDFGSSDIAYFSIPETPPKGGVVVLHDEWGMADRIKAVVDRLAAAGYVAVAPDLFNGQIPSDADRAAGMARDLARDSALHTVAAAVHFLRESPRFRCDRVVVVGWGVGGGLAWAAAAPAKNQPPVAGAALVGMPLALDGAAAARTPGYLLGLFDPAFPADVRADLQGLAGKKNVELRDLAGPPTADQVWPILLAFLDRAFTGPAPDPGSFLDRMNPFKEDKPDADRAPAAKAEAVPQLPSAP